MKPSKHEWGNATDYPVFEEALYFIAAAGVDIEMTEEVDMREYRFPRNFAGWIYDWEGSFSGRRVVARGSFAGLPKYIGEEGSFGDVASF